MQQACQIEKTRGCTNRRRSRRVRMARPEVIEAYLGTAAQR
jgi:hypothetical protein